MSHDGHDMHSHSHSHEHPKMSEEKAEGLLKYMLDHNIHHAEELHSLAHRLEHMGKNDAAAAVDAALQLYQKGNEELEKAVKAL